MRICANLPYNIATALLTRWLEAEPWPPFYDRLTLMFQREVALRIVATPAERADYGRLAVLAGWRARARLLFDVPPAAFTPPPKVDLQRRRTDPARARPSRATRGCCRRDAGRVRPAAQDVAPVAEKLRRRAGNRPRRAARRGGARSDAPRRRDRRRRILRARARGAKFSTRSLSACLVRPPPAKRQERGRLPRPPCRFAGDRLLLRRRRALSGRAQRLSEIGEDVVDVLEADRQADIAFGDAGGELVLGRKLRMGRRRRMDGEQRASPILAT